MIDRILISLAAGAAAFFVALVGLWILSTAMASVGPAIPAAAAISVFVALFTVDFLTDYLAKRQPR